MLQITQSNVIPQVNRKKVENLHTASASRSLTRPLCFSQSVWSLSGKRWLVFSHICVYSFTQPTNPLVSDPPLMLSESRLPFPDRFQKSFTQKSPRSANSSAPRGPKFEFRREGHFSPSPCDKFGYINLCAFVCVAEIVNRQKNG